MKVLAPTVTYSPLRVLATALLLILGASLVSLGLAASSGCTPSQLRTASVLVGAAARLACTGAVVALDAPGWSGTVCSEAAGLVAEALGAEAARREGEADAGTRALAPPCVTVVSEGRVVGSACRRAP